MTIQNGVPFTSRLHVENSVDVGRVDEKVVKVEEHLDHCALVLGVSKRRGRTLCELSLCCRTLWEQRTGVRE